ncbi:MAG: phosphatidylglycerol lysyltransferase domain-containing protein [Methanoregula sp.]|nr:phosphatidylglycerol lysyltransferase domain-containing protein [Methanoregula sp.]MDD5023538.1 phosphatidylglycerol lysyltransferase domain-containing protein [Methanoregula sp.]MDD5186601.1 phosphatidylglycerol lysyltransferase domain-containing protein [Methanoregula sp.]
MLEQEDFQPVTLADRDFFTRHYALYPQMHSDNTFTNMVCWNHYAHYRFAYVNRNLILASTIDGITRFRPPIGQRDPALLKALIRLASDVSDNEPVVLIDPDTAVWMREICCGMNLIPDRNHFEYVYRAADLAELPGKQYLTIRHQINKFRRNCAYALEPITAENRKEVMSFLVKWCEWKGCENDPVLAHEKESIFFAVDHFNDLDIQGLMIRVNHEIAAISLYEPMNTETALVHFEKGLPDCEGIYKAINAETAALLATSFTYINRESDLGVAGLREAKQRYHPHHMVEVYSLKRDS